MEIKEFQQLMYDLYAHNDRKRGAAATMLWLVEEVGELAEAVRRNDTENIREELADCFAWVGALANLCDVDLELAFLEKYPLVCPTCGKNPCVCID
ncbi:MazG nucleotide pyrophosphohydrolase domain-containing protein [Methanomethylovorans sp.]|uniref:MazG nucleotide pyrophosphohydrolase domain-containing protein n=1 Tax=Methanomethylovorans sp. TaxID=2758717 RepID=UPI00351C9ED3